MVRGILQRLLGCDANMDDAVQEVFLQLFRTLPTLRQPTALRAFVMAIAARTGLHQLHYIKSRRQLVMAMPETFDQRAGTADVFAEHALIRLRAVLLEVRPKDRAAFVLRFMAGMQVEEIAEAVGVSTSTIQRRFRRARIRVIGLASRDMFLQQYVR